MTSVDLDAIDLKILRELQRDGRMTNVELAERVGISAPPCLRRVRKLEEAGVIEGYHAMLNAPKLGFDLVAFCMVGLKRQSDSNLKAFAAATALVFSGERPTMISRAPVSASCRLAAAPMPSLAPVMTIVLIGSPFLDSGQQRRGGTGL